MTLLTILDTEKGQIMFSVILGLGLASLFRKVCYEGNCVIIEGPPLDEVENKIFKQDNKCFRYKHASTKCEKK